MFNVMSVNELYPRWLTGQEKGQPILLIDVRSEGEYAGAHVPGSQLLPLNLLPLKCGELPKDRDIYLICHAGGRSAQAAMFLARQGFTRLTNIDGGMLAWSNCGYPCESGLSVAQAA